MVTKSVQILLLALALTTGAVGCGARQWTTRDTIAQTAVGISLAIDYGQTGGIVGDCVEANPIMGKCGENVSPGLYFLTAGIVHAAISYALPNKVRAVFQWSTTGVQTYNAYRNAREGY